MIRLLFNLALLTVGTTMAALATAQQPDNPCTGLGDPSLRRFIRQPLLYDGVAKLARSPDNPAELPDQFKQAFGPGCVVFEVMLENDGDSLKLRSHQFVYNLPPRTSDRQQAYIEAGARVLESIGDFSILPGEPLPGGPHLIAVPLWSKHGFYASDGSGVVGRDLEHLQYYDAEMLSDQDGISVYRVGADRGGMEILAMLKPFADEEEIVEYVEAGNDGFGRMLLEYGEGTMTLIEAHVLPHLPARTRGVEIRLYADNETFASMNIPDQISRVNDPRTNRAAVPPLGTAVLVRQGGGRWAPASQLYRPPINTLASARAAYREVNPTAEDFELRAAERRTALAENEARRARIRAERLARQSRREPGIVYKSERFWAALPDFDFPRAVFEGTTGNYFVQEQIPRSFVRYVQIYSGRCSRTIEDPVIVTEPRESTEYVETAFGTREARTTTYTLTILVDPLFYPKYAEYSELVGDIDTVNALQLVDLTDPTATLENIGRAMQSVQGPLFAWGGFFDEAPCGSATLKQMGENMLRVANGEPSAQEAGISFYGAAGESEPLVVPESEMTFFDACNAHFFYEEDDAIWCSCIANAAPASMTDRQIRAYTDNFQAYTDRVFVDITPPASDTEFWSLYAPVRACQN